MPCVAFFFILSKSHHAAYLKSFEMKRTITSSHKDRRVNILKLITSMYVEYLSSLVGGRQDLKTSSTVVADNDPFAAYLMHNCCLASATAGDISSFSYTPDDSGIQQRNIEIKSRRNIIYACSFNI